MLQALNRKYTYNTRIKPAGNSGGFFYLATTTVFYKSRTSHLARQAIIIKVNRSTVFSRKKINLRLLVIKSVIFC